MPELTQLDLYRPVLPDQPPQWRTIPAELWEKIAPRSGFFLIEEWKSLERIMSADWLLIRNGQRYQCGRCNGVHDYMTFMCVERPFNRLNSLWAYINSLAPDGKTTLLDGFNLGTIVPITREEYQKLAWKIALRGGKLPQ